MLNETQTRSRSARAAAGGDDRLFTDDGGHYIARRFNGPTDAFNHFAQDANFNRGGYRALEDSWAKATAQGKAVIVRITPEYRGTSQRPYELDIAYSVGGLTRRRSFPNAPKEKSRGKH